MDTVTLEIACNCPKTGIFLGRAKVIHLTQCEFETNYSDWSPRLTEGDGWIRIGGKKLRCTTTTTYAGNYAWNHYECKKEDVEDLLNWAKFRKWFDLVCGPVKVHELWQAGKRLKFRKTNPAMEQMEKRQHQPAKEAKQ